MAPRYGSRPQKSGKIADDMCLRLQNNHRLELDPNFSIHDHALGRNDAVDMSPASDHEGRAVKLAVNEAHDGHRPQVAVLRF